MSGNRRRSGLLIPLFSSQSANSWGVGDIADLFPLTAWLAAAGQQVLQLLPLNEMAPGQQSPYSAISAMAIDPIFISVPAVPEFEALGGLHGLDDEERARLTRVRQSARVEYDDVRWLKRRVLERAFARFFEAEWRHDTDRARLLKAFNNEQSWWLEEYALFRAIHIQEDERPWTSWPESLRRRDPDSTGRARRHLWREVLFHQYLQWVADTQWRHARANNHGVEIFGDLPFMVDGDSADVWTRQEEFRFDASLGAPPDAFSATGQDWGVPVYRWDVIAARNFSWLRERARRHADLYDGMRVDHLVGFYRTFGRILATGEPFFTPPDQPEQEVLGERVLHVLKAAGIDIIAEDLGTVPDFVRDSLARIRVPGFRVLRWERHWHTDGQPFRDPIEYPAISVATSGTHDTEPLLVWWQHASADDRRMLDALPLVQRLTSGEGILELAPDRLRDVLLEALFASGSNLLLLPVQDVFGWSDRINEPSTVSEDNWRFRLPWPCDRLDGIPEARERRETLHRLAARYQRL